MASDLRDINDKWETLTGDFFIEENSKTEFLKVSATTDCGDVKTKVYTLKAVKIVEDLRWAWRCAQELPKPDEIISETFEQTAEGEVLNRVIYHYELYEEPKLEYLQISVFATEGDTLSLENLKTEILPLLQPEQTYRVQKFKEETLSLEVVDKEGNVVEDGAILEARDSLNINISAYLICQTEAEEPVTFSFVNALIVLPDLPVVEEDIVLEEPVIKYDCLEGEDEKVFVKTETVTTDEKIIITNTYAVVRTLAFDAVVLPEMPDLTIKNGQIPDLTENKLLLQNYFNSLSDYVELQSIGFVTAEGNDFNENEALSETITLKGKVSTVCGNLFTNDFQVIVSASAVEDINANKISVSPSIVRSGEDVYIKGLSQNKTYVVEIYNLSGACVKSFTISNVNSYNTEIQSPAGYYMMRIVSDTEKTSFKYFVR